MLALRNFQKVVIRVLRISNNKTTVNFFLHFPGYQIHLDIFPSILVLHILFETQGKMTVHHH